MPRSSEWPLFRSSNQNFVCVSHLSSAFCVPRPSHPPWFDHPNNWWSVEIYEAPHYSVFSSLPPLPQRFKYSPQHPVLKHPQSVFFP
jgi:hypothetical protein